MKTFVKTLFLFLFFIMNFIFIFIFSSGFASIDMLMSISFIVLFIYLTYHISSHVLNISMSSYLIFNYLFFFIAPLIQLHNIGLTGGTFPNTMYFDYNLVFIGILSIIIFNTIFFTSYFFFRKRIFRKLFQKEILYKDSTFFLMTMISIIILFLFFQFITNLILKEQHNIGLSIAVSLIIKKILFSIPIATAIYFIVQLKKNYNYKYMFLFIVSLILLIIFKNPMMEKRNALGPIYLSILYFSFPGIFRTNFRTFIFLFLSMVILFPLVSLLTHNNIGATTAEIFSNFKFDKNSLFEVFSELHYDAFSNLLAAFSYIDNIGITYGMQLFSGLFFFVPREIWVDKPLNGGFEIGNYLMNYYNMWFNNLSMPFVGESLMNFGMIGLVIYPIILSIMIVFFDRLFYSKDLLKKIVAVYFSFHMIFLLRGDFTNAFAYFMGTFVALYIIPKTINKFTKIKGV